MKTFKNIVWAVVAGIITWTIAAKLHFHTEFERPITHHPAWPIAVSIVMTVFVFKLLQSENK